MSSYFDDASLVMIPSGYKDQKVYSVKPLDGSGDLTFSRASSATRVASNGLIEKVRTNVLTYSQDFSNANWVGFDVSRTGSQTDPNGGTTASLYTAQSNFANVSANFSTVSSSPYTLSIYIKGTSSGSVSLRVDSGSTAAQNNISYTTSWQRFTYTFTAGASTSTVVLGGYATFTTGEGIYVAFAQAELGDIATDYIATTSAAVSVGPVSGLPRLDYLNSTCPRLLLEPQRTNLTLYSEQFNDAAWGNAGTTITANQAVSPDGYSNADLAVNSASSNYIFQGIAGSISGTFTTSIFAKKGTESSFAFGLVSGGFGSGMGVKFNFDTQTFSTPTNYANFTSISASYQSYGNGWYRLNLTGTTATSTVYFFVLGSLLESFAVNAYVYGAQVEAGAYATSYIPTLGTSVTRVADAASKTGISSLIGQTEGTIFLDVNAKLDTTDQQDFSISDGTTNNRAIVRLTNSGIIQAVGVFGGNVEFSIGSGAYVTGQRYKIALAYKLNDVALYVNGVQSATDTSATISGTLSRLGFDIFTSGAQTVVSPVNQALLFKTRLTNAQLAELTTL